jgi:hypothetical protein
MEMQEAGEFFVWTIRYFICIIGFKGKEALFRRRRVDIVS